MFAVGTHFAAVAAAAVKILRRRPAAGAKRNTFLVASTASDEIFGEGYGHFDQILHRFAHRFLLFSVVPFGFFRK